MGFLRYITAVNNADLRQFWPFWVAGYHVGWVRPDFSQQLAQWPTVFAIDRDRCRVSLSPDLDSAPPAQRTVAVAEVLSTLRDRGLITHWRDEPYAVTPRFSTTTLDLNADPLMTLERAAAVHFGITGYGVHVNGYVPGEPDSVQPTLLWLGERALDRPSAPGQLDQLAAGGLPAGLSLLANARKECWEEAQIPDTLSQRLVSVGTLSYCYQTPQGLRPDVLYVFDLPLPASFIPESGDGEMAQFHCWPLEQVATVLETQPAAFKFNSALVVLDFLIRHGYISPEHPEYLSVTSNLRRSLPFASMLGSPDND